MFFILCDSICSLQRAITVRKAVYTTNRCSQIQILVFLQSLNTDNATYYLRLGRHACFRKIRTRWRHFKDIFSKKNVIYYYWIHFFEFRYVFYNYYNKQIKKTTVTSTRLWKFWFRILSQSLVQPSILGDIVMTIKHRYTLYLPRNNITKLSRKISYFKIM